MNVASRIIVKGEVILITIPIIAKKVGCSEAIVLQHLHYWLSSKKSYGVLFEGKRWIKNSIKSWHQQISVISERTIRRCFKNLEDLGLCEYGEKTCVLAGPRLIQERTITRECWQYQQTYY